MEYPFSKTVVYWCIVITILSIVLVLLVLQDPLLLIYYFVSTSVLTVVIFELKLRFLFQTKKSESLGNHLKDQKWKRILLTSSGILLMILPIILLVFLPPVSWFMCLNVFVSSLSLSEVVLFYYAQKS